ncbi:MAG: carboxypeptidase M32 [Gemmataceae bacterium]
MTGYDELITRTREAAVLASCGSLLSWDESTYMPRRGGANRGEQMALLARLGHEMASSPRVGELLAGLGGAALGEVQSANVREIRRAYERAVKVPAALVEELARVTTNAQGAWRDAKKASDFAVFRPHLERIVALLRDKADAIGHGGNRYDALLDEYEPGATAAGVTRTFAALRAELVPLILAIADSGRTPDRALLSREFPLDRQRVFGEAAAAALGFDFDAGRLDVSAHPFCCTVGPGDCRITTRYSERQFNESFFGVMHETGHAIYEQNLPPEHAGTPAGQATSLGIHESQSRLWENQVGRSRPFWEHFLPRAVQTFPSLRGVSLDAWMFAVNDVRPSFIRVEADETTYNLHIILRFEIEQALLSGSLAVADLPGAWDDAFEAMFGMRPPDAARGCLQDIHWSFGGLGYFPTYTLGNLYAAQLMNAARTNLPGLDDDFRRGDFGRLRGWLNANVHGPGGIHRAEHLCARVTGSGLDHRPLVAYLREKAAAHYGV